MESTTKRPFYNIGIIGAGRIAQKIHIQNILSNPRLKLKWIVDELSSQLDTVREMFNLHDLPMYPSSAVGKLLSSKDLDAVFVFTFSSTHADYTVQCLNNGKSVFVEKPLGRTTAEVKACYDAAEKNNKVLLPGFMKRHDPTLKQACQAVKNGYIGDIRSFRFCIRGHPRPSMSFLKQLGANGGDLIQEAIVHGLDLLVWLTDCIPPETIIAQGHAHDPEIKQCKVQDTVMIQLKLQNGVLATIDGAFGSFAYDARLEVCGTKGQVVTENIRSTMAVLDDASGGKLGHPYYSYFERFAVAFKEEIQHFVDCLDGNAKPCITKDEVLLNVEIAAKASQSLREERFITV